MVVSVGWQWHGVGGDVEVMAAAAAMAAGGRMASRGREWGWGSGRSGDRDPFWTQSKKSAGNVFRRRRRGGWTWERGGRKI
ncbi:hypothetical protein Tco_1470275 [Tanacetum coccineum]